MTPGVLLTGAIGVGKTAVAVELGALLEERGARPALLDLDWLGWLRPRPDSYWTIDELIARNLSAMWPNLRAAGADRLVLTRALRRSDQLAAIREALPDVALVVVRVNADAGTIEKRLRARDSGEILREHLSQAVEMAGELDSGRVEDFRVENDGRPVQEVAHELLRRLGWP
jgi:adenylylsulfate kinase